MSELFIQYTFFYWFSSQVLILLLPTRLFPPRPLSSGHRNFETLHKCDKSWKFSGKRWKCCTWVKVKCLLAAHFFWQPNYLRQSELQSHALSHYTALARRTRRINVRSHVSEQASSGQHMPDSGVKCWHRWWEYSFLIMFSGGRSILSIYSSLLQTVGRFNAIAKSLAKSTNESNAQKPLQNWECVM